MSASPIASERLRQRPPRDALRACSSGRYWLPRKGGARRAARDLIGQEAAGQRADWTVVLSITRKGRCWARSQFALVLGPFKLVWGILTGFVQFKLVLGHLIFFSGFPEPAWAHLNWLGPVQTSFTYPVLVFTF